MKRFLFSLLCALAIFTAPASAQTVFNIWQPKGNVVTCSACGNQQVLYLTSGCVVVASPCFRMWYTNNGSGAVFNVLESSDGLTNWMPYSGNPVMTGVSITTLWNVGGTFYLFASPTGLINTIDEWTSPTGLGTWTHIGTVLTTGTAGSFDDTVVAQLNLVDVVSGIWYAYYSGCHAGICAGGLATSLNGTTWTKAPTGQPSITGLNSSSSAGFNFTKTGTTYYAYGQADYNNAQLSAGGANFTSIFRWSASDPFGPWTQLSLAGNQIPTYYAATAADFFSLAHNNQLGDPNIVVANGNIYLYYDIGAAGSEGLINEAIAVGVTPQQLAAGFEGVMGVPVSGAPQLNFTTLGSDAGTGANANPIGGNWTTNPFYFPIQRNSNLIEVGQTTAGQRSGIAYWNAAVWPNDQWAKVTAAASVAATTFTIALRQNTGVQSLYYLAWTGALGGSGTANIEKIVAGTGTSLTGTIPTGLTMSVGDTLTGVINGHGIYYYYDDILIGLATDSSVAAGAAGLYLQGDGVSTADVAVSAWSGGGLQNAPALTNATQIGGFLVSKNWRDLIPLQVAP